MQCVASVTTNWIISITLALLLHPFSNRERRQWIYGWSTPHLQKLRLTCLSFNCRPGWTSTFCSALKQRVVLVLCNFALSTLQLRRRRRLYLLLLPTDTHFAPWCAKLRRSGGGSVLGTGNTHLSVMKTMMEKRVIDGQRLDCFFVGFLNLCRVSWIRFYFQRGWGYIDWAVEKIQGSL